MRHKHYSNFRGFSFQAPYGVENFRIPRDWKAYFDLEVAALYLGFVVLQFVLSVIPVGKLVDGLPDKLGRLQYRCNGNFLKRYFCILDFSVTCRYVDVSTIQFYF